MKNLFEKFIPSFLKAIDRHFLLHHRLLWITKVHYVLFYVGIALLLSMAYINWFPIPYSLPKGEVFMLGSCFLMLIPFGFWVFKQISFSIENNYGKRFPFLDKMRFGLYLVCFLAFLSVPFGTTLMMQHQVASYVDDATFDSDRELLNLYNPFLLTETEINNKIDNIAYHVKQEYLLNQEGYTDENFYEYIESYNYPKGILEKVAFEQDNLCQYYSENALGYYSYYTEAKQVDDGTISDCNRLYPTFGMSHKHKEFIAKYIEMFNRYGGNIELSADEIMAIRKNAGKNIINMEEYIPSLSYQKDQVRETLNRIADEKYNWRGSIKDAYEISSIYFFLAFFASLLLSMYTMVRTKDFIVAVISFIGLGIVTAFTSVMIEEFVGRIGTHRDSTFFVLVLGVYIFATFQGLRIFTAKHFSMFKTVCLILSTFATPFVIIWVQALGEQMTEGYSYHDGEYYLGLVWAGIIAFSILVEPIFRRLFLKIQSLPKA